MAKRALITGVTGQDGAYLANLLLSEGYEVYGAHRRSASLNLWRLDELGITSQIRFVEFELLEFSNILRVLERVRPAEIYNLAAQSFVGVSFEQPLYTAEVDGIGVARLLEAIRVVDKSIRYYQASTSEMFGKVQEPLQSERTPFYPRSPYGVAKLYAHWMTVNYRESYSMHTTSGILFNHESPFRGLEFVTRKITSHLAMKKVIGASAPVLALGNLDARRDWGFADDYVRGMHAMVQRDTPDDYVLATGVTNTVRWFVEKAAAAADLPLAWEGENEKSVGRLTTTGEVIVQINPAFYRPAEVDLLVGDSSKARRELDWTPRTTPEQLVEKMMKADLARAARGPIRS